MVCEENPCGNKDGGRPHQITKRWRRRKEIFIKRKTFLIEEKQLFSLYSESAALSPSIMSMKTSLLLLWLVLIQKGAAIRPVVTFTPDYRKIFTGENITMTCDVGSTIGEGMRYYWYKDRTYVFNGKSYTIPYAGTSQSGSYQCETSNGERSDPVTLDVSDDWVILQTPLYVYEGDNITIRCHHYPGSDGRQTIFYKDNRTIRGWTYNEEYYIRNVDKKTTGTYRCIKELYYGWNQHGDESSVSVEDLFSPPVLTVSPESVIDGDTMTLSCDTNLSDYRQDTDLQYAFYRDGRTVQGFTSSNKYQVLFIHKENSGTYTCEIRTPTSGVRKESQGLHIQGHIGYTHQNIIRLTLSVCVLISAALFVVYHIKWMKSMEAADTSTT